MSTIEKNMLVGVPSELQADTEAVLDHLLTGKPMASEVVRKIRERGERIREDTFRKHGVLDIGTPAIRELRDT